MLREDRYKKKMGLGQEGNSVVILLAGLAIFFCIFKFIWVVFQFSFADKAAGMQSFYSNLMNWVWLSPDAEKLISRPWTLLTYMLIHDDAFRLLGNVLWLWAFGYILQDLAGNSKLIPVFIYSALAGSVFFVLSYNTIPQFNTGSLSAVPPWGGAEAGVMGVAIATTLLSPNYRLFPMINGGIPVWILTLIFVVIDLAAIPGASGPLISAHLAGAAMGFVFTLQLRRGSDWSVWMNNFSEWVSNLFNPDRQRWQKTAKDELYYNTGGTEPYKKVPNITQKRIDEILDKINQQGYRFLTEEEKEILKRAAEGEEL